MSFLFTTKAQLKNALRTTRMKGLPLILVSTLTACWYSSSSKNAVASQRLVEEMGDSSPSSAMLVLTVLQLLTGLCISFPLYKYLISSGGLPPVPWKTQHKIVLGFLHFLGCLCTNMGFALGSASVVQVIKLMEPIETLILTALANILILRVSHGLTFTKTISVITIVVGTAKLLSQKRDSELGHQVNFGSISFALCSGFAMASRNVYMKTFPKKEMKSSASIGWKQIAVNGLFNFISLTSAAAAHGILYLIFSEILGSFQIMESTITSFIVKSQVGREAIVFHGLYNIASISVLCLISTQSHSLLNVGKRIVNVLYAALAFHESIGFEGIVGLFIVVMGGTLYSAGNRMSQKTKLIVYFAIFAMFSSSIHVEKRGFNSISFVDTNIAKSPYQTSLEGNVIMWTYPYKPSGNWYQEQIAKNTETTFFCGFPSICRQEMDATHSYESLNLRELTTGTPYESFISHHFYYKVLHGKEYIHHVQSVAICSMALLKGSDSISVNPTSTTNTLRQNLLKSCKEYDPTKNGAKPIFREAIVRNQSFATLGYDTRDYEIAESDFSNEIQGLAGLQFLPEHTITVDRYEGYESVKEDGNPVLLIANAWNSPPPLPTDDKNDTIVFTSFQFSTRDKRFISWKTQDWKEYISQVGLLGARDQGTLNWLQHEGLPSYLSLSFTLNFQIPRRSKLDQKHRGDEILLVDVTSSVQLPPEILARATKLENNVVGRKKLTEKERHEWARDLLSAFADRASIVITSEIYLAFPASAMGIPVIFVEGSDHSGLGKERRESALFHLQDSREEWKYGNLTEALPPVPGAHLIDRHRALYWKLLKERSPTFEETARLYGMIPLQRLGRNVADTYHSLFHFIVTTDSVNWKMIRAIEYVFYHHPNARVMVHCQYPDLIHNILDIFVETGYDLVITSYDMKQMIKDFGENEDIVSKKDVKDFLSSIPMLQEGQYWYSHESDVVRFLIIYTYGGIYLDIDVFTLRPFEKSFVNNLGSQGGAKLNGAYMNFEHNHPLPKMALQWIIQNYNVNTIDDWGVIGPDLITKLVRGDEALSESLTILKSEAFQPIIGARIRRECFEGKEKIDLSKTYAIHLNNKLSDGYLTTEVGTPCDAILHRFCIFCHEIHSTGAGDFTNSPVVTFPDIA